MSTLDSTASWFVKLQGFALPRHKSKDRPFPYAMITLLPEYSKDRVASLDVTSVSSVLALGCLMFYTSGRIYLLGRFDVKLDGVGLTGSLLMLYLIVSSGPILQYNLCPFW